MLKFFLVIIIFLVALFLFLAVSVGVALGLVWIFPTISFEIGVLIGTVSLSTMCHLFFKRTSNVNSPSEDESYIDRLIIDKINDEFDLNPFIPPRPTGNRRKRR